MTRRQTPEMLAKDKVERLMLVSIELLYFAFIMDFITLAVIKIKSPPQWTRKKIFSTVEIDGKFYLYEFKQKSKSLGYGAYGTIKSVAEEYRFFQLYSEPINWEFEIVERNVFPVKEEKHNLIVYRSATNHFRGCCRFCGVYCHRKEI